MSVLIGIVTFFLVSYQVWRNHLVGPDIRMIDARYRGVSGINNGTHVVPESWTYVVSIRNDGSRSGEIRGSTVEVYECEPSNIVLGLHLARGNIDGIYPRGEPRLVTVRIAYVDCVRPDAVLLDKQITKLVAMLKWNREIRKGFAPDIRILNLVPQPQIQN